MLLDQCLKQLLKIIIHKKEEGTTPFEAANFTSKYYFKYLQDFAFSGFPAFVYELFLSEHSSVVCFINRILIEKIKQIISKTKKFYFKFTFDHELKLSEILKKYLNILEAKKKSINN
ncbi:hypothetical protein BpHYR1_054381 [Brachionus plicatilis]|uniref:Uncharacterized protein n=1 Tax=Brachionus plicatilis TaxID=10195 RepID=A0A3M7QIX4_BRAPC|nr:hypothetical protein BpHYR1_054381 [Brachionus plicatilis]